MLRASLYGTSKQNRACGTRTRETLSPNARAFVARRKFAIWTLRNAAAELAVSGTGDPRKTAGETGPKAAAFATSGASATGAETI